MSSALIAMREAMTHRGPDDAGYYASPENAAFLGHRRLSIIDLSSAGRQPMPNEDGSVWITFNGEIYNHDSLRDRLVKHGHVFRSLSDTESILHLYEELGPDCVSHLDGMFAFAIWDENRQRLFAARDRLGKKPLYYTFAGAGLYFASEIKALLTSSEVKRDLNLEALDLYLTFGNVPAPHTLFAGIHKLPAGHVMLCDHRGALTTHAYWSAVAGDEWSHHVDEPESIERVRHLIEKAVAKRLISDVPVGAFLSGGVDSSTNVALMSRLTSEPLRTFSIAFEGFGAEQNFHDVPFARQVANQFGCEHCEVMVTPQEAILNLQTLIADQDEPNADPACLPMHFVSRIARESGVVVVLVGEGSDEVFGGYEDMARLMNVHAGPWKRLLRSPGWMRKGLYKAARARKASGGRVDLFRRAAFNEPLYWGLDVAYWEAEKADLYRSSAWNGRSGNAANLIRGFYDDILKHQPAADFLQQMAYVELRNRLPELLLMRVDKHSMRHSLEARAPFLDHELVSYALSLPANLKIRGNATKHVLKEAVRPYLPSSIVDRRKQGFRVPLPEWLRTDIADWAKRRLFGSSLINSGLFNMEQISCTWERHQRNIADHANDLWCLLNLAVWYEHWIEGQPVS